MSSKSNLQGRAYEYACIITLYEMIKCIREVVIIKNSSFDACRESWEKLSENDKNIYKVSCLAAVKSIFKIEPRILENDSCNVELMIQPDKAGENGDVRDILIIRSSIKWEIGLSLKHNNFAVKHSRIATNLDFGKSWFGVPCSPQYWNDVSPVFQLLSEEKQKGTLFKDLIDKEEIVYIPLLEAFIQEIKFIMNSHKDVPAKLVEYLLGRYDFYKIISVDAQKYTSIQAVNLHGTLSLPAKDKISPLTIPIVKLPSRMIYIGFTPGSKTTVELYLDGGWQFTFRLHNASSKVEPSLKFDIKIVGMPTAVITLNCRWI